MRLSLVTPPLSALEQARVDCAEAERAVEQQTRALALVVARAEQKRAKLAALEAEHKAVA